MVKQDVLMVLKLNLDHMLMVDLQTVIHVIHQHFSSNMLNADSITYKLYLEIYGTKNPFSTVSGAEWSNGKCPHKMFRKVKLLWGMHIKIIRVAWLATCLASFLI